MNKKIVLSIAGILLFNHAMPWQAVGGSCQGKMLKANLSSLQMKLALASTQFWFQTWTAMSNIRLEVLARSSLTNQHFGLR